MFETWSNRNFFVRSKLRTYSVKRVLEKKYSKYLRNIFVNTSGIYGFDDLLSFRI